MKSQLDFQSKEMYLEYLRTYFAAMALQGIISAHNIYETGIDNYVNAQNATKAADELINALNQPENDTNNK